IRAAGASVHVGPAGIDAQTRGPPFRPAAVDPGTPPSLIQVPAGCAFHPRCEYASLTRGESQTEVPALRETAPGHLSACHLPVGQRRNIWAEQIKPSTRTGEPA